ncbi:MAG TPA: dihydrodipicolinate synthase family protein [Candidatus Dormibacteraeota bacterium]|jgi:4-hydroxy-tetrahydrodipicolinate synthase|nr:dihydrodipicolinate synthase family protein [Candidatus Dormibacteraeota bacterium]
MTRYQPGEAREWAMAEMRGVVGCVQPTLKHDMSGVNEKAIRHDVALERELGYAGCLLVGECGTTPAEMRDVVDIGVDEARRQGMLTVLQAAEPTLEQNVELIRYAAQQGVDLVLPSYPLSFYPQSEDDVFAYTRAICEASHLGVILFAVNLWNFGRLHPSDMSPQFMQRCVDELPSIVAIKTETGMPGVAGISEVFERFRDRVVVTDPFEMNAPAWASAYGMRFLGTSNYEYFGGMVPRYFALLQQPDGYDAAMEIYWRVHPARQANSAILHEAVAGTNIVPRMIWKYQGWLNGFNGGPIRSPHTRITDRQMAVLRRGLQSCGLEITSDPDSAFFEGRNPD